MKLIVAEVVHQMSPAQGLGEPLGPLEGCTWYPDGRVWVLTREGTPNWRSGDRRTRRGLLRRDTRERRA